MSIESRKLTVDGIAVEVVRKNIKNLHLGVYPPGGRVRVAAPRSVSDEAVKLAVIGKLAWIRRQRARFTTQPRQSRREWVAGETHYFLGRRYRLRVREHHGPAMAAVMGVSILQLFIRPGSSAAQREAVVLRWYREQLRALIPALLDKWQTRLGVAAADYGIKRMKTKWGSCSPTARRIWLNLELAKKPPRCLEYIVVHEMLHLKRRRHDEEFIGLMNKHLPGWRLARAELNHLPLSHEEWSG